MFAEDQQNERVEDSESSKGIEVAEAETSTEDISQSDGEGCPAEPNVPEPEDAAGTPSTAKKAKKSEEKTPADAPASEDDLKAPVIKDKKSKIEKASSTATSRAQVIKDARQRNATREQTRQENAEFLAAWAAMEAAMRTKRIVHGIITGVEEKSTEGTAMAGENRRAICIAVMLDNGFKVTIPFSEMFRSNPIDMNTVDLTTNEGRDDYVHRQKAMAEKLYGNNIPLLITYMDISDVGKHKDFAIAGSRRMALQIIEKANFFPDKHGITNIEEGDFVDASIFSVGPNALTVNVAGVDAKLPKYYLTYKYISDLRDKVKSGYEVGGTVKVKITAIKIGEDGCVNLGLDARDVELEVAKRRQGLLPINTEVVGVITSIRGAAKDKSQIVCMAYLPYYEMPVIIKRMPPANIGREPIDGDEVRLTISGYNDAGFALATCRGFNGAPGFFSR